MDAIGYVEDQHRHILELIASARGADPRTRARFAERAARLVEAEVCAEGMHVAAVCRDRLGRGLDASLFGELEATLAAAGRAAGDVIGALASSDVGTRVGTCLAALGRTIEQHAALFESAVGPRLKSLVLDDELDALGVALARSAAYVLERQPARIASRPSRAARAPGGRAR